MTKSQSAYNAEFTTANKMKLIGGDDKSNVSFCVAKVDSPMMTGKRSRIINSQGNIDSKGRLEIKINRLWVTIKKGDGQEKIARAACKNNG